jgi:hypothetical protein
MLSEREAATLRSGKCVVHIWRPAPTVLVTRAEGVLTDHGAMSIESTMRRIVLEDGALLGFHDWENVTDYDLAARVRLTAVSARLLRQIDGAHFLTGARAVSFGVQMANAILKKLTVHPTRAAFDRVLDEAIRARRRHD